VQGTVKRRFRLHRYSERENLGVPVTHFAVKKLTASDLTFFEHHYKRINNKSKQKALNLNADVFIDDIFPYAPAIAAGDQSRQFLVRIEIFGPGLRRVPDIKARKIIRGDTYKNWRLNGEFVPDPDEDPTRYHSLAAGDLAVFAFDKSNIKPVPESIALVLVSQAEAADTSVFAELSAIFTKGSMALLLPDELANISAAAPADHPIRELLDTEMDAALEDAALGSTDAIRKLRTQPSARRMSAAALARARASAESNGRAGEELVNIQLKREQDESRIRSFTWVSEENAISPWDFEVVNLDGTTTRIEVKSTNGSFDRPIHISQNEVLSAAEAEAPRTDLYRVFAIGADGGWLRISQGVAGICQTIVGAVGGLGVGITADGYSIHVARLSAWSEPVRLAYKEQDDCE
jgi:hypothetical protein